MDNINSLKIRNKEESSLCSGLYLVPTPIGNLRDITLRSLDVLNVCDVLICEDTRVTGRLLKVFDLKVPKKVVYNDHADDRVKGQILNFLNDGLVVAMVSDAGTPLISDPGYKLVRECLDRDIYVTALPGANAVLPAIQLSGFANNEFLFKGFLSFKNNNIKKEINFLNDIGAVSIFYESPRRIEKTLKLFEEILPARKLAVVREISKLFEEVYRGTASEILERIADKQIKGEIVLVVDACHSDKNEVSELDIDAMIVQENKKGISLKDLSNSISSKLNLKKKIVYNRALEILKK